MTDNASADSSGKGSKIVLIATVLNTVGMIAVAALTFIGFQKDKERQTVADIALDVGEHGNADAHGKADAHGEEAKGKDGHGSDAHATGEKVSNDTGKIIPMEPFTINLASTGSGAPRYLRMNLSIELDLGNTDDELKAKTPRLRDSIINILNSKKASDLSTPEGRDLLKEDIRRTANGYLVNSKIRGVYFTNFAVSN